MPQMKKFDGAYPELWPKEFPLNPDTYLITTGKIAIQRVPAIRGEKNLTSLDKIYLIYTDYRAKGVTRGSPHDVLMAFVSEAKAIGLDVRPHEHMGLYPQTLRQRLESAWNLFRYGGKRIWTPRTSGYSVFDAKSETYPKIASLHLVVFEDPSLKGWSYFRVSMVVYKHAPDE